jgi:nicotinamide-nucleotide amidase
MTRAERLLDAARRAGLSITTAESCTGGLLAATITGPAGASDIFDGGVVTYSNRAKERLLGVRPATLAAHGAVSEPVAAEMAEGALAASTADIAVAVTGIAGPGGSEYKPEGRVCFGLARRGATTRTETVEFGPRGRTRVREAATDHALDLLLATLG